MTTVATVRTPGLNPIFVYCVLKLSSFVAAVGGFLVGRVKITVWKGVGLLVWLARDMQWNPFYLFLGVA